MSSEVDNKLIVLYQEMADMTLPECKSCRVPLSCCDSLYCEIAQEFARDAWEVDLGPLRTNHPSLPFMGETGCVVPPHLRPMCALHTCSINSNGFKRGDPEWTDRYFKIRNEIEELEYKKEFHEDFPDDED